MRPITISLVPLGTIKHRLDYQFLESWPSKIIKFTHHSAITALPNAEGDDWDYTDSQLKRILRQDPSSDLTVGLINAAIEDNYYMRRLAGKVAVLSLYDMAEIVLGSQFTIEQFILRNCYEMAVIYTARKNLTPDDYKNLVHDDIRGCLMDMNSTKSDILFSLNKPVLCSSCTAAISTEQLPKDFVTTLTHELKRIRKPLYARTSDWIKKHPVLAFFITSAFAVVLNIIASAIYDYLKR